MKASTSLHGISFNQHHIAAGDVKVKVWYSLDGRHDSRPCVTIHAKEYGRNMRKVFPKPEDAAHGLEIENNTESQRDYYDTDTVRIFEGHPLYAVARTRAELIQAKQQAKNLERRNAIDDAKAARFGAHVRNRITERIGGDPEALGQDAIDAIVSQECKAALVDVDAFNRWVDARMEEEAAARMDERAREEETAEPTPVEVTRHDFPDVFRRFIGAALALEVVDATELVALGAKHGADYMAIREEVIGYAFVNRHGRPEQHAALCPLADAVCAWHATPRPEARTVSLSLSTRPTASC